MAQHEFRFVLTIIRVKYLALSHIIIKKIE